LLRLSAVIAFLILLTLAGCGDAPRPPKIRLTSEAGDSAPGRARPTKAPVRIAVAPLISHRENFRFYAPMMDYLAQKLDRPVEFLQRPTYREINDLLRYDLADLAFVCTRAYVQGQREFGMQFLVAPQVMGKVTYHSLLIVPADSGARSLEDLRGKRFAFSDPLSSSGWLYPTYLLALKGERSKTFFESTIFTHSHDNTVRAVADGLADGGVVHSLVYDRMVDRSPELVRRVRVIGRSPPWGNPPIVVNPRVDPSLRDRLLRLFLAMDQDPAAKRFLADLKIERFVSLDDTYYKGVRAMVARIRAQQ
jgi:phosphonate transport system substrate-binding protein